MAKKGLILPGELRGLQKLGALAAGADRREAPGGRGEKTESGSQKDAQPLLRHEKLPRLPGTGARSQRDAAVKHGVHRHGLRCAWQPVAVTNVCPSPKQVPKHMLFFSRIILQSKSWFLSVLGCPLNDSFIHN